MISQFDFEIGLDLHHKFSVLASLDKQNRCLGSDKIPNVPALLDHYFEQFKGTIRVTFECTRNYYWLADYLDDRKIPFIMANPYLNRAIASVHAKNDKYDARTLAYLSRCGLVAQCYVPNKFIRHLRELLHCRTKLIHMRTQVKNRIHVTLAKYNHQACYKYIFGPQGRKWIESCKFPEPIKDILKENLNLLDYLNPKIDLYYQRIKNRVLSHPYYTYLESIYGISVLHAATIIAYVADINRFPRVEGFIRYAGLAVNTRASADKLYTGHLDKHSNKYLRTTYIEASHLVIRHDQGLRVFYDYLKAQKGHGCAIVAVARKLARSTYFMLKKKQRYHPRKIQKKYLSLSLRERQRRE